MRYSSPFELGLSNRETRRCRWIPRGRGRRTRTKLFSILRIERILSIARLRGMLNDPCFRAARSVL